jgi:hypothetical protein
MVTFLLVILIGGISIITEKLAKAEITASDCLQIRENCRKSCSLSSTNPSFYTGCISGCEIFFELCMAAVPAEE